MAITEQLRQLIKNKYTTALENKDVLFVEADSTKVVDKKTGMKYVVSFTPSLKSKPERADAEKDKIDPFAKLEPELTVLEDVTGNGRYKLVLNKFPVVPEHSLLVTNAFEHQMASLTPEDLITSYEIISKLNINDNGDRHMVFYNSGPLSGSSQDHKHLQIMKIPDGLTTLQDSLCNGRDHYIPTPREEPLQNDKVAFAHFAIPLPTDSTEIDEDLLTISYFSLLQRALTFFQDWLEEKPELADKRSYNVIMTQEWLCVIPRSSTQAKSLQIGFNATGYTGFVLVKEQSVFEKINQDPSLLNKVLLECGFPSTAGQKTTEYNY
ncbi:hypothetical protein Kpol_2000p107 [Vanderwaltozyma polyspora DSM 70294]|uniref:Uncharacterized protein n=1 Tax=Vanderwaltozyma polyspora (strain ATCC 22028 / DSM 70294 / BCRC 21397 / CBS 2163 / NBRC 10782 / NRRL Y-8283 / UCD 57-17) TaxID=436907 RepID=A7TFB4_VANPO|nr:uncharacterized protein Kpol_2000p107 [Vanderwaltozyma polyspora DSM 70294]EDO19139.1 hypothetical protein Kpol_2000p107 [Vanderwaltozyma polyspora DSM 70294]